MDNYINKVMSNHVYNSDSSEDLYYLYNEPQKGGEVSKDIKTEPHGGFPPIFIVEPPNRIIDKTKNRELIINKTAVSITDILRQRRQIS